MTVDADWVERVMQEWNVDDVPEICQQFGCRNQVQTWCPLCRAFFCDEHDQLVPVRKHDCLKGKAEAF